MNQLVNEEIKPECATIFVYFVFLGVGSINPLQLLMGPYKHNCFKNPSCIPNFAKYGPP